MRALVVGMLIGVALPGFVEAQEIQTGFLDRSVVVDGTEYLYQVFVPRDYQDAESWPVILALHGGGSRGDDGVRQTASGLGNAIRRDVGRFPAITVFPQGPVEGTLQDLGGRVAMAALDQTLGEFRTDPSRVYLVGHSMGGNGSWYLAYHHPERFAAALIVSGFISEGRITPNGMWFPGIPSGTTQNPFGAVAERVSGMPIWIFHGEDDLTVPVDQSRQMAAALQALGADVQYTELPGVGHNAHDPAYARADVTTWLFAQEKR